MFNFSSCARLRGLSRVAMTFWAVSSLFGAASAQTAISLPDLNGDGVADYFMRLPVWSRDADVVGQFRVFSGSDNSLIRAFTSLQVDDGFAISTASPGDIDGDGVDDLIVGAPLAVANSLVSGKIYLISGASSTVLKIINTPPHSFGGITVAGLTDLDADGLRDAAFSVRIPTDAYEDTSYVIAYSFGADGSLLSLRGEFGDTGFGYSIACLGDTNNDGSEELAVASPVASSGDGTPGAIYVYELRDQAGVLRTSLDPSLARITIENTSLPTAVFGGAMYLGPDIDADGTPELVVGSTVSAEPAEIAVIQAYNLATGELVASLTIDSQKLKSDINGDLVVDNRDVAEALNRLNQAADPLDPKSGDINGDGIIDAGDVVSVIDNMDTAVVTPSTFSNGNDAEVTELVSSLIVSRPADNPCLGTRVGGGGSGAGGVTIPPDNIEGPTEGDPLPVAPPTPQEIACCLWKLETLNFPPGEGPDPPPGCVDDDDGGGSDPDSPPRPRPPGWSSPPGGSGDDPPECDGMTILGPTFVEKGGSVTFTVSGNPAGFLLWDVQPYPNPLILRPLTVPNRPYYSVEGYTVGAGRVIVRVYENGDPVCGESFPVEVVDCNEMEVEGPGSIVIGSQATYTISNVTQGITADWTLNGLIEVSRTPTSITVKGIESGSGYVRARAQYQGDDLPCVMQIDVDVQCGIQISQPPAQVSPGQEFMLSAGAPTGYSINWSFGGPVDVIDDSGMFVLVRATGCGVISVHIDVEANEGPDPDCSYDFSIISGFDEPPFVPEGPDVPVVLLSSETGVGVLALSVSGGTGEFEWSWEITPPDANVQAGASANGRNFGAIFHEPASITVRVDSGICDPQSYVWTFHATRGDLRADSNSDGSITQDDEISESQPPGFLVFVDTGEDNAEYIPVQLINDFPDGVIVPWSLEFSNNLDVFLEPDEFTQIESGAVLAIPVPDMVYVRGNARSFAAADTFIALRFGLNAPGGDSFLSDALVATVCELVVHDLRHWGPQAGAGQFQVALPNPDPYLTLDDSLRVGGAVTDGASLCIVRIEPRVDQEPIGALKFEIFEDYTNWPVQVPEDNAAVFGTLMPQAAQTIAGIPQVPFTDQEASFLPTSSVAPNGYAMYCPPEAYTTADYSTDTASLSPGESSRIYFVASIANTRLGRTPFTLRRPPIVLVHGLNGAAVNYWGNDVYGESAGSPVATRVYIANYESTNASGYAENIAVLPVVIRSALHDYRTANDGTGHHPSRGFGGIRYAATRVDVIGHSMGGQLARLYVSNLGDGSAVSSPRFRSTGVEASWAPIVIDRYRNGSDLRFLRSENFFAGDVRRLITIGSPFRGSPIADLVEPLMEPLVSPGAEQPSFINQNPPFHRAQAQIFLYRRFVQSSPSRWPWWARQYSSGDPLRSVREGSVNYSALTALNDLRTDSAAMDMLSDSAIYPSGRRKVPWYPLTGVTEGIDATNAGIMGLRQAWIGLSMSELLAVAAYRTPSMTNLTRENSDLVVDQWSQRNARTPFDSPNADFPKYRRHTHTVSAGLSLAGAKAEAYSDDMSMNGQAEPGLSPAPSVRDLLNGTRTQLRSGQTHLLHGHLH